MTPSSTFATSSQRSVASSRKSSVSFHFMTTIGSRSSSNSRLTACWCDAVGLVLEPVDLDRRAWRCPCCCSSASSARRTWSVDAVMICASSRAPKRTRVEPVEPDERRRRVDRVHHVVERPRQRVDVLAVERRDERPVQALDDLVRQEVALVLDLLDLVGLVPDRIAPARASPRAGARRASARRPAPGSRCRTSLRAESVENGHRGAGIVADSFTRPLRDSRRCTRAALRDMHGRCR